MSTWAWEVFDASGVLRGGNVLSDPWADTPDKAANLMLARWMVKAAPEYRRLSGWRVRVCGDGVETWADADEWLQANEGVRR
ncbi:hypothetical protein AB0K35_27905 [Micromonospora sp. NPDC053740]|uniref:hypothetical protein n=1 Tax=Micromonospora sp. NPDC053740 TaxID=3155173 RepID=UPI003434229B